MARLIDVDARIEEIRKNYCSETSCDNYHGIKCRVCWVDDGISLFDDAPTVDAVEVVHAHWEDGYAVHNGKITYHSIDCSHCQGVFKAKSKADVEQWKEQFVHCPFCGAKMDGGNEDG